jgi:hypothetical protein
MRRSYLYLRALILDSQDMGKQAVGVTSTVGKVMSIIITTGSDVAGQ